MGRGAPQIFVWEAWLPGVLAYGAIGTTVLLIGNNLRVRRERGRTVFLVLGVSIITIALAIAAAGMS